MLLQQRLAIVLESFVEKSDKLMSNYIKEIALIREKNEKERISTLINK